MPVSSGADDKDEDEEDEEEDDEDEEDAIADAGRGGCWPT
jgi:hypothetical protein